MRNIISSLCLLILFISCKETEPELIVIDADQEEEYFDLAAYYQATDYVGLTFPDSVSLSSIKSSKIKNDKLYIHDLPRNQILVFDLQTESFLYTIHEIGEGPEEYQLINDFDVDENDILYLYDYGRKIIAFKDGQFYKEWNDLKLHTRGFQKTNNGFLLISPDESYEQNRSPIVEIDQQGKVLNLMGGEMMEKLAIPMKYFQKVANSIYINDMFNNQIVVFNMDSNTIEYLKFGIEDGSSFQIIDFWQVSPENCFVMTAVTKGEDDSIVISSIEKEEFVSNFSSFVCSLDLLTMSSFPTNDDKGEFDYTLLTDEYFPAFSAYLDNATTASGSLTSRDDEYTYEDFSVKKEKFDANRAKIQGIMGENKILMRKYLRK